jgi:murein DD-endopeptidase MepM/ murein hydrolase activator NlpD
MYFSIGEQHNVPWYYLAAVDKAEGISEDEVAPERTGRIAVQLRGIERQGQIKEFLVDYRGNRDFFKRVNAEISKFKNIRRVYDNKVFPIARGYQYNYKDDFGGVRTYGGERTHEGIDIMCAEGVPIVSVCNGVVEKKGWLELGGWRLGIRGDDGMYYYYAHFSRYHKDIREGSRVKKGQVIGYAGDSGYGGEGTTGKFEPHLHFGMYEGREAVAVNPYPFLKKWERNKVDVK